MGYDHPHICLFLSSLLFCHMLYHPCEMRHCLSCILSSYLPFLLYPLATLYLFSARISLFLSAFHFISIPLCSYRWNLILLFFFSPLFPSLLFPLSFPHPPHSLLLLISLSIPSRAGIKSSKMLSFWRGNKRDAVLWHRTARSQGRQHWSQTLDHRFQNIYPVIYCLG